MNNSRRLITGKDAIDQLLHAWNKSIPVQGVGCEAIGVMAGEHEVMLDVAIVGDGLQSLLDAV